MLLLRNASIVDGSTAEPRPGVDILIEGVSRGDPAFDSLEYMLSEQSAELPAIWAAHGTALLKEAERRGIARPIWGELHYESEGDA